MNQKIVITAAIASLVSPETVYNAYAADANVEGCAAKS